MTIRKLSLVSLLAGLVAASLNSGIAGAVTSVQHPAYLHARSDLRKAELLLQQRDETNVEQETKLAYQQVHLAIQEIDKAAVLDKKDLQDNPNVDTSVKHLDKFRAIYKLLRSAEKDISEQEDTNASRSWRNRAKGNLEQAKHYVEIAASRDVVDDLRSEHY
ncbi:MULTISPECIES: hypothetical protein [Calothrix]|uniref:Uncharacterized protein n=2 Tax=Calothrix TaxID=1186 RepID=A0ABR8AA95_9CYAN|nr:MULTISPECIES: hypothetical protein [Calothrix]MBD2196861.1 hypothetical protein [Calothrix parietina FACHB-288]MBD2225469.1 hypothetical protein [Calothrix anomala FACHB-343]